MDRKSPRVGSLLLMLGAVVFGMVLAGSLELTVPSSGAPSPPIPAIAADGPARSGPPLAQVPTFADLAEAVLPSVVSVHVITIAPREEGAGPTDLFERFFRNQPKPRQAPETPDEFRSDGGGSGFIIDSDGWIVTNFHVVDGATSVSVHMEGRDFDAVVKGTDPTTDLALLKVDAGHALPRLELGTSEGLRVGEWVMVIGSPLQLESTVTVGVVSGTGRSGFRLADTSFENFIQTDAAINRGNSGGPLVNTAGEVIGIATAMNFGAENIGFAVPVDTLRQVLPQLREHGRVRRGYLGVSIANIDYDTMKAFGMSDTHGALVQWVQADTPAYRGGLRHGDIILKVDRHAVHETRDLIDYVAGREPGSVVQVQIQRGSRQETLDVTLGERETQVAEVEPEPEEERQELEWLGVQYEDLTPEIRGEREIEADVEGVYVSKVAPSSPLYDKGIDTGDVIVEVNGQAVASAAALGEMLDRIHSGDYLRLYVRSRFGGFRFAVLRIP